MNEKESGTFRKSLFVSVGDLSADKHAARLIAKLKEVKSDLRIWGVGGPEMIAQGFEALYNCADFAVLGVIEVLPHLRFLLKMRADLLQKITEEKPDALLLIDHGALNLRLARMLRKDNPQLPILYFISPQVWASRPWRIKTVAENVSKMLVIFPFEETLYQRHGVNARFVGHPLTRNLPSADQLQTREEFCKTHDFNAQRFIITVYPGSRKQEIKDHMSVVMDAMLWLLKERSDVQFVVAVANEKVGELIKQTFERSPLKTQFPEAVKLVPSSYDLMANADIVWAKSGTTTLETTLFGKPMLIFYRGAWISYALFMLYKSIRRVGWPNLLAGEELVPELIQLDCRPEQLVRYTRDLLDVPSLREEISQKLLALRDQLGQGDYATNCVAEILQSLDIPKAS